MAIIVHLYVLPLDAQRQKQIHNAFTCVDKEYNVFARSTLQGQQNHWTWLWNIGTAEEQHHILQVHRS